MGPINGWDRRRFITGATTAVAGPVLLGVSRKAEAVAGPLSAEVAIEPEEIHGLPQTQYGHFIEHLGMCIKGGIWAEGESDDMFLGGVRPELVEAMRSINPPLIRYPGGCFADGYHWEDGVGPRAERPVRPNLAWGRWGPLVGPREDNHFGTDEFCLLSREGGAEPMLTANVGSGTAAEAAAWVEYTNGGSDTPGGRRRAANGHPEPYGVKYWFVGNEILGWHEIGFKTPEQYVQVLHEYGKAMRAVDPTIKLIAVGGTNPEGGPLSGANQTILSGAGEVFDYLSIHQYVPPAKSAVVMKYHVGHLETTNLKSVYYDIVSTIVRMTDFVEHNCKETRMYSPGGKTVPISFDEWNLWFNFLEDITLNNYNLRDGVWAASMLNLFHRHAPTMPITNIAQMVNCLGIITSTRRGTFLTPTALAFKLYTERAGEQFLHAQTDSPAIPHDSGIPALDLSATAAADKLALFMLNRHYDQEMDVRVVLKGRKAQSTAQRSLIHHRVAAKYNTYRHPTAVTITTAEENLHVNQDAGGSSFIVRLPPHSINCLEVTAPRS